MVAPLFRRKGFPAHRFPVQLGDTVAPFVPVDFPGPARVRQRGTIEVAVSLLLTTLAVVTAVQNVVIRDPLYSVAGGARSAPEWQIPPNLLTNTLAPVVAGTPFEPIDLPLNRRVVNVPQFDPVRNISVLQLQAAPFKPVDLPIERAVSNTSPFEPSNVLISIPVAVGSPFVEPYVTPIVAVPRQILSFEPPNVTINLPTTVAVPFKPVDWTPPPRARTTPQFDTPNLQLPVGIPFKPYDWTTPGRAKSATPDWVNGQNIVLVNAVPFTPTDWSLTKAKQQVGPFEPPNLLLSTLSIQPNPPAPVVIFDWKLTQNAWQPFLDTIPNLLTSTFNPTSPPVPPPDVAPATPGRTLQGRLLRPPFTVESDEDKRARRAREAAEDAPKAEKAPDLSAYYKQSARISKAISDARAEADTLRPKIAELEAKAAKAKLTAKLEKQLLHAQQKLTLISVQEAVLLEEMEAIDVAFIALIAYMQATS